MTHERLDIHPLESGFGSDDERDPRIIDTIIIHSMYNPNSETPYTASACKAILDEYEVSADYLVDREGKIWQLVPENRMAWHAGKSRMPAPDQRPRVNSFSIGIELIGNEIEGFTDGQYDSLTLLVNDIMGRSPISYIFGHKDITQGVRENPKTDPWNLDWQRFRSALGQIRDTTSCIIGPQA